MSMATSIAERRIRQQQLEIRPVPKPAIKPTPTKQETETKANNNAALAKLKNLWNTGSKSSEKSSPSVFSSWKKPSSAQAARAARAEEIKALAQLKRDAKGDAKLQLVDRRYLTIKHAQKSVPVYFKKDIITGKLLDKAAESLSINLKTQNTAEGKMALFHERTQAFIPYNEKLTTTLGGIIKDGDTITLKVKPINA